MSGYDHAVTTSLYGEEGFFDCVPLLLNDTMHATHHNTASYPHTHTTVIITFTFQRLFSVNFTQYTLAGCIANQLNVNV